MNGPFLDPITSLTASNSRYVFRAVAHLPHSTAGCGHTGGLLPDRVFFDPLPLHGADRVARPMASSRLPLREAPCESASIPSPWGGQGQRDTTPQFLARRSRPEGFDVRSGTQLTTSPTDPVR